MKRTLQALYIMLSAVCYSDAQSANKVLNTAENTYSDTYRATMTDGSGYFKNVPRDTLNAHLKTSLLINDAGWGANTTKVYSKSALLSNGGVLITDTFTVASATPTVSFSSILSTTGKSNFKLMAATGFRAGATASTSPQVSVTALTSNSATFNITQQNTATVTILGINVLSGLPLILAPDPQNVKLVLSLIAY